MVFRTFVAIAVFVLSFAVGSALDASPASASPPYVTFHGSFCSPDLAAGTTASILGTTQGGAYNASSSVTAYAICPIVQWDDGTHNAYNAPDAWLTHMSVDDGSSGSAIVIQPCTLYYDGRSTGLVCSGSTSSSGTTTQDLSLTFNAWYAAGVTSRDYFYIFVSLPPSGAPGWNRIRGYEIEFT